MKKGSKIYYLALNLIENVKSEVLNTYIKRFKNIEDAFNMDYSYEKFSTPEKNLVKKIKGRKDYYINEAENELNFVEKDDTLDIKTIEDKDYPSLLKDIFDPPLVLYIKGKIPENPMIAVVGARSASRYGKQMAFDLSSQLVERGLVVISGMAIGIDAFAHKGALSARGETVAVLGSGLFRVYPDDNYALYKEIAENGAVISEFRLNQKPERYNFPKRNRIVSGMSLGTLIVEAGNRSGALITASCALDQGREVFAVPGDATDPHSVGTNRMIKDGAKLVQNVDDIVDELNIEHLKVLNKSNKKKIEEDDKDELTKEEKTVLKFLLEEPQQVDDLYNKVKMDIGKLEQVLMLLEIKGYADQVPGHKFRRIN